MVIDVELVFVIEVVSVAEEAKIDLEVIVITSDRNSKFPND
jgi:hypothetical protein